MAGSQSAPIKGLKLHCAPDNASLCIRLALAALALPYQAVLVDRSRGEHKSADYLALNPNGLIPVLEGPQGPIFETGAILMWLAEEVPGLLPARGAPGRAHVLQWMFWLANTLHPALRRAFYPENYSTSDPAPVRKAAHGAILRHCAVLETARDALWLDRGDITLHGCYLAPLLRWAQIYCGAPGWFDLAAFPRLMAFAEAADVWPATQEVRAFEGLGPTPFSAAQLPNPPEGKVM